MISLFSFLHTRMVIVQFRGRLVRQYRACVVDSLVPWAGNYMCLISQ